MKRHGGKCRTGNGTSFAINIRPEEFKRKEESDEESETGEAKEIDDEDIE